MNAVDLVHNYFYVWLVFIQHHLLNKQKLMKQNKHMLVNINKKIEPLKIDIFRGLL